MNGRYMRESAELQVARLSSGTLAVIQREIEGESGGVVKRYKGWKLIKV